MRWPHSYDKCLDPKYLWTKEDMQLHSTLWIEMQRESVSDSDSDSDKKPAAVKSDDSSDDCSIV